MNLDNFIYDFNLATTKTVVDGYERCEVINMARKREIIYQDCVSLYDIVKKFNEVYQTFALENKDFNEILSQLGDEVWYEYHSLNEEYSVIVFNVFKPFKNILDNHQAVVSFINRGEDYYANANNGKKLFDSGYVSNALNICEEEISSCFELVKKYDLFFESFKELKNNMVFGNGTTVIFTKIDGNITDKLSEFTLSFGNSYLNYGDFIEVKFRLGKTLKILYGKSKVALKDEEIKNYQTKKKIIDELLQKIYVNNENLGEFYKVKEKEKEKVRKRG